MDGIIDISVARTPLRLDEVSYMELCSEPMIAVSAPENAASSLKLADLLHRPLILYRRYEELIMNTFHAQNMNPDIFCVCDDPRGAMLWAKENLATAIFPQSMASLCDGLCIQELDEPALVTKILLIWLRVRNQCRWCRSFWMCVESVSTLELTAHPPYSNHNICRHHS